MIEYLNTAGGEGFRYNNTHVAAAEAEMEVRQEAGTAGKYGYYNPNCKSLMIKLLKVSLISSLEEPDSTEQQDIKSNTPTDVYDTAEGNTPPADVNGSADDILPHPEKPMGSPMKKCLSIPGSENGLNAELKS